MRVAPSRWTLSVHSAPHVAQGAVHRTSYVVRRTLRYVRAVFRTPHSWASLYVARPLLCCSCVCRFKCRNKLLRNRVIRADVTFRSRSNESNSCLLIIGMFRPMPFMICDNTRAAAPLCSLYSPLLVYEHSCPSCPSLQRTSKRTTLRARVRYRAHASVYTWRVCAHVSARMVHDGSKKETKRGR